MTLSLCRDVIPVEGRNEWADHEVIALGHLLAEGNLCHPHSVYFYSQDEEQVKDFVQAANAFENVKLHDCHAQKHLFHLCRACR
jgi:DNA polymerase III subunit alpha